MSRPAERCIIDCDPGIDDCLALLLAFASPSELTVDALTLVMGNNNDLDILADNACLVLEMCGLSERVPVIKGACKPLAYAYHGTTGILVHGPNGIGGVDRAHWSRQIDRRPMEKYKSISAAQFMVQHCLANPGEITLVGLGPLTNLALAVALGGQPFIDSVRRVVIMGGSVEGIGNKTAAAEANLANDPHAGRVVFDSFPAIVMAGLNATHQLTLDTALRTRMKQVNAIGEFCHDITEHYVNLLRSWGTDAYIHDPTAIMYMIRPSLFDTKAACVDVEDQGRLTSGQTVADWSGRWGRPLQTLVIVKVDAPGFYELFIERLAVLSAYKPNRQTLKQDEQLFKQ